MQRLVWEQGLIRQSGLRHSGDGGRGAEPQEWHVGKEPQDMHGDTGCRAGQEQRRGKGSERGPGFGQNCIQGQRSLRATVQRVAKSWM